MAIQSVKVITDAVKQHLRSLKDPATLEQVQQLLSKVMAVVTVLSATFSTIVTVSHTFNPRSSGYEDARILAENPTLDQLTQPLDISRVWEDSQIRTDIAFILNRSRTDTHRNPLNPDIELSIQAQHWAERNAITNSFRETPAEVIMVQTALPNEQATAVAFLDLWFQDAASQAALATKDAAIIGVGVASAAGKTYAVIQLAR
ncbi:serine protease [Corynebacterium sp. HS2168-gen11]|uniref:serine protease n=1 Tax=Corynebacterium sp. HS2168-gen11 TaxID=2974027 RepID=UPI00216B5989|nr:serine protease [Corynebacterium sp. HS2168-gen11]MCS4535281.1 serine protease [Corynebacterium sp. HS2168-gen11]